MPHRTAMKGQEATAPGCSVAGAPIWKLEDAKARFSEVVRRARTEGPQRVTVRGKEAVVVISAEALGRLLPEVPPRQNLVAFLHGLELGVLDPKRKRDTGRDVKL